MEGEEGLCGGSKNLNTPNMSRTPLITNKLKMKIFLLFFKTLTKTLLLCLLKGSSSRFFGKDMEGGNLYRLLLAI
jgi:hypothetical protein